MPDDIALEKVNALKCFGATIERVRPASIVDNKHVRPPRVYLVLNLTPFLIQYVVRRLS